MKPNIRLLISFAFLFLSAGGSGQTIKKVAIGQSGCSLYTYCDLKFDKSRSEDSSAIYTAECVKDGVSYGVICVQLLTPPDSLSQAEEMMIAYLDYLKTSFDITQSAGYGKGHRLHQNENTRGVLDYWEDKEKNHWKVKAWTDRKFIGVLYAYSNKPLPESKVNVFLDGFRLP